MPFAADREPRFYKPGQIVPISGVYTVLHQLHRYEHDVLAIRGDEFPPCRVCKSEVRFRISNVVPHITHDFDLAGPRLQVRKARANAAAKGAS
jgi:hypothetical protein